jgi:uncharacterized protein YejL (UPF0352 family)
MANKKVSVEVDIETNVEPSLQQLRELKKELRNTAAGSDEFKKVSKNIKDVEDSIEEARFGAKSWVDQLEQVPGPLGGVFRGLRSVEVATKSFGTALKATGIGLIVAALGGLVAAFTQNEAAMKKLEPIFIAFQKILGGIFRALEPMIDALVDMAMTVLPYVTKGIGIFYSALVALFTYIKEAGTGVFKFWKGLLTLDFDSVKEGVTQIAGSFKKTAEAYTDSMKRFTAGTKEQTKIEKENLAARQKNNDDAARKSEEAAKKAEELRKAQLESLKADLDAKITLETNSENTSREKLKALLDARYKAEIEDKKLSDAQKLVLQQEYAKKLEDAINADEEKKKKKREADLDAQIQLEISKAETRQKELQALLDARMAEELANLELSEAQKEVIRAKYAKQLTDALKEDEERRKKERIDALQLELDQNRNNATALVDTYAKLQQELTNQTSYSEAERAQLRKTYQDAIISALDTANQAEILKTEEKYGEFKRFDDQYYTDLRAAYTKNEQDLKSAYEKGAISSDEYTKRIKQSSQARRQLDIAEKQSAIDKTAAIGNALGQLSSIVGQDTIAGKAFAIAKATIDTYQSAVAAYKSLAGIPIIGPALGAIAAAAAVASGIATVKKIVAVQVPNAPAGAGPALASTPSGPAERPGVVNVASSPASSPAIRAADGGLIRGPGTERSDSIPAMLSDGEFVVNARSTRLFQPILSAINASADIPGFAMGGLATKSDIPQKDNSDTIAEAIGSVFRDQPIRTYVTAGEISNEQQFDRIIKSRSLI